VIAVAAWCAFQLALFWALTTFTRRVLRFEPSETLFSAPQRVLGLSIVEVGIAAGSAWILERVPGVGSLERSIWFARLEGGTLILCVLLALVPTLLNVAAAAVLPGGRIERRPAGGAYPIGALAALVTGLLAHAFIEELAFRNVPLALLLPERLVAAYAIPVTVFVVIHFLEPGRPRTPERVAHLMTGALFFFVVAWRFGLLHATLAHATANLSVAMTEGYWSIGAPVACRAGDRDARFLWNAFGYLVAATLLLVFQRP
jgi:hypothetical protein